MPRPRTPLRVRLLRPHTSPMARMAGVGGSARTNPERRGPPEPSCGDSFLKPHFKTQPRAPPGLLLRAGPAAGKRKAINAAQSLALGTASPSTDAIRLRRRAPGRTRSSPAARFQPRAPHRAGGGAARLLRAQPKPDSLTPEHIDVPRSAPQNAFLRIWTRALRAPGERNRAPRVRRVPGTRRVSVIR